MYYGTGGGSTFLDHELRIALSLQYRSQHMGIFKKKKEEEKGCIQTPRQVLTLPYDIKK